MNAKMAEMEIKLNMFRMSMKTRLIPKALLVGRKFSGFYIQTFRKQGKHV